MGIEDPDKGRINGTVPWQIRYRGKGKVGQTIHVKGLKQKGMRYEQRVQELKKEQVKLITNELLKTLGAGELTCIISFLG